jgi:hypothetical protein
MPRHSIAEAKERFPHRIDHLRPGVIPCRSGR